MNTGNSFLNTSHLALQWFHDLDKAGGLDLQPGYQRRPVWTDAQKSFLIDSILRQYPVPEIYIQTSYENTTRVAVVDGQQRLRACLEYMNDQFSINFDRALLGGFHDAEDTPWMGKTFSQLDPAQGSRIRNYKFVARDLESAPQDAVRHLFHRLNQSNVSLNAQELRYSIYQGGLLKLSEDMANNPNWDRLGIFTPLQRRRMNDTEFISELVIGHLHFPQNKKDDLDEYYRRYSEKVPAEDAVRRTFTETLSRLADHFPGTRMDRTRWANKSDFYTLFLAITREIVDLNELTAARLHEFSRLVNQPPTLGEPASVREYREAVTRAATDRTRRVHREKALQSFLTGSAMNDVLTPVDSASEDDSDLD